MRRFNITLEQYIALLEAQHGVCALCEQPERVKHQRTGKVKNLAVDHDRRCCAGEFSCGKCVRGLLCYSCNVLVGRLENSPIIFAKLAGGYCDSRPLLVLAV